LMQPNEINGRKNPASKDKKTRPDTEDDRYRNGQKKGQPKDFPWNPFKDLFFERVTIRLRVIFYHFFLFHPYHLAAG